MNYALTMNLIGSDTGVMKYDFLKTISRRAPAVINDEETLAVKRQALEEFGGTYVTSTQIQSNGWICIPTECCINFTAKNR